MTQTELPITGYLDRFSHRPGDTFTAYVSVRDGGTYRARLVRVLSGDPNPNGPGVRFQALSDRFDRSFSGRRQDIRLGSCGIVDRGPMRDATAPCTWTVLVQSTLWRGTLLSEHAGDSGITLTIGKDGLTARIVSRGAHRGQGESRARSRQLAGGFVADYTRR